MQYELTKVYHVFRNLLQQTHLWRISKSLRQARSHRWAHPSEWWGVPVRAKKTLTRIRDEAQPPAPPTSMLRVPPRPEVTYVSTLVNIEMGGAGGRASSLARVSVFFARTGTPHHSDGWTHLCLRAFCKNLLILQRCVCCSKFLNTYYSLSRTT